MDDPPLILANLIKMRSLKEAFLDAQYTFFKDYAQDSNKPIKYSYDHDEDYPAMLYEISDLQDTLLFAVEDLLPEEYTADDISALNANKVFDHYFESIGEWWLISFFGLQEALNLLEDFFNRYFPILQREMFFNAL